MKTVFGKYLLGVMGKEAGCRPRREACRPPNSGIMAAGGIAMVS